MQAPVSGIKAAGARRPPVVPGHHWRFAAFGVVVNGFGQRAFADGDAGIVFVLSIPDWGVTPFAADRDRALITAEIAQFNAVNRAASERAGVLYIDITPASRRATVDTSLLAADDLHPSGKMYALWVKLLLPAVIKALEQ